jgi:hypothetical protein
MLIPPFDESATCPKCGSGDINTRHIVKGGRNHFWRPGCGLWSMSDPEHMDRHCRRRGYEWAEAPLDAPEPAPGSTAAGGERR